MSKSLLNSLIITFVAMVAFEYAKGKEPLKSLLG